MANPTGAEGIVAARSGALRTPPNKHATESVSGTTTSIDLTSFDGEDLRGKWVFFTARGADVTMRRFVTGATAPTLTAGVGFTIADGATEELFVPSNGGTSLEVIASGAGNLDADFTDD